MAADDFEVDFPDGTRPATVAEWLFTMLVAFLIVAARCAFATVGATMRPLLALLVICFAIPNTISARTVRSQYISQRLEGWWEPRRGHFPLAEN
jgi:hypothetical protein